MGIAYDDHNSIEAALKLLEENGQVDGAHHKAWVIDQVARTLLRDRYDDWKRAYENGGEYEWDEGIAP